MADRKDQSNADIYRHRGVFSLFFDLMKGNIGVFLLRRHLSRPSSILYDLSGPLSAWQNTVKCTAKKTNQQTDSSDLALAQKQRSLPAAGRN